MFNSFATSWTVFCEAPLFMGFLSRNTRVGCHFLSRRSPRPKDWTPISCIGKWTLYHWATWEALYFDYVKIIKSVAQTLIYNQNIIPGRKFTSDMDSSSLHIPKRTESINLHKDLYMNVHKSISHNGHKVVTIQVFLSW